MENVLKAQSLDRLLDCIHFARSAHPRHNIAVNRLVRSHAAGSAHVIGLHRAHAFDQILRNEHSRARRSAHAVGIEISHANNSQWHLVRDHGKRSRILAGRLALRITQYHLLAQQRPSHFSDIDLLGSAARLSQQFSGKAFLQNHLMRVSRRKKLSLHAFETVAIF